MRNDRCTMSGNKVRVLAIALTAVLGFGIAACETTPPPLRTEYDFDKTASFQAYKTYAWVGGAKLYVADNLKSRVSPLLATRLGRFVDEELAAKGLRFVDNPNAADVVVGMTVGARNQVQVEVTQGSQFGRFYTGYSPNYWPAETRVTSNLEGSLAIDLFDAKMTKPVWHGKGTRDFSADSERLSDDELRAAVSQIMANYPPTP